MNNKEPNHEQPELRSGWNYRVLEETDQKGVPFFRIIEAGYNFDEEGDLSWIEDSSDILSWDIWGKPLTYKDTYHDLKSTCKLLKKALAHPLLMRDENNYVCRRPEHRTPAEEKNRLKYSGEDPNTYAEKARFIEEHPEYKDWPYWVNGCPGIDLRELIHENIPDKSLKSWNYRVLEIIENKLTELRIIEVFYNEKGVPVNWIDNKAAVLVWRNYDDLKFAIECLKYAFEKPILTCDSKGWLYNKGSSKQLQLT